MLPRPRRRQVRAEACRQRREPVADAVSPWIREIRVIAWPSRARTQQKSRLAPAFCVEQPRTGSGQRADARIQAALVAGSLVLVDQATGGVAIDDRRRRS